MKPIEIHERLRPFSHTPGIKCLIPSTCHQVQVFPTLVRLENQDIPLEAKGPLHNFTVVQDLERCCVTVFSEAYHFHILPNLQIVESKHPHSPFYQTARYSFGRHKKLQWERLRHSCDFAQLFPIWLRLGMLLTLPTCHIDSTGMFSLLAECEHEIAAHRPELILPAFHRLFLAGFGGMMVPRNQDEEYQGILSSQEGCSKTSALYLLTQGAELIRSLFLRSCGQELVILPHLPPELFAGRIVAERFDFGTLDMIWSKKQLKALSLHTSQSGELHLHFPAHLHSFRLKRFKQDRGRRVVCGTPLAIEANEHYVLDCFEK
ncbi:MAG: hypothetical protein JSS62_00710 [Verrucomicrobia bacterium]|nr:hypothetical protein [Verrucomicrobiota bacterium]MBS0645967.1 hypothetical protein [Verrucomicrobiota bacterium]